MLEINRNFGQSWYDAQVRDDLPAEAALRQSSLGVTFYEPVDVYQRNYRAVHYAALLIVITFLAFFLWEHMSGTSIHAMQYLMVGMALALFYLLLLALSEHLAFDYAYGISAGALVVLITAYLSGVLGRLTMALGAGAGLAALYLMLYWILRSEDYSLLMGALLLFGVLAILMLTTRRVDWSSVARRPRGVQRTRNGVVIDHGPPPLARSSGKKWGHRSASMPNSSAPVSVLVGFDLAAGLRQVQGAQRRKIGLQDGAVN